MITGIHKPSHGSIRVNGIDVVQNTKKARESLGYCPQHNLLFDDLTVYEHLELFSKFKQNYNKNEIIDMLNMLSLTDKKDELAHRLSGGMKRKLSVAIAFIGGSKIVILDEPSSGMDPQARHSTWSLLQSFRKLKNRSILLTTHFMDEADYLGDRIIIMSRGKIHCSGSPIFLKSMYGSGYSLILTRKPYDEMLLPLNSNETPQTSTSAKNNRTSNNTDDVIRITKIINSIIPNSKLKSNINTELNFVLPIEQTAMFSSLLMTLEENKDKLNIINIGISVTTIEDIFLKIENYENCDDEDFEEQSLDNNINQIIQQSIQVQDTQASKLLSSQNDSSLNIFPGLWIGSKPIDLVTNFKLYFLQFKALFMKRFIHSFRNKALLISQLLIPIGILIFNILTLKYAPIKAEDSPPLPMDLTRYSATHVPFTLLNPNQTITNSQFNLTQFIGVYKNEFSQFPNTVPFELNDKQTVDLCPQSRSTIEAFLICIGRLSYNYILDDYLIGTAFEQNNDNQNDPSIIKLVGYFNGQPYHVRPLTLNLLTNSLLKYYSNSTTSHINIINHPLPRNVTEKISDLQLKDMTGFKIATGLTFGFSFLIASFVIFLIKERTSNAKHLQYMSGANSYIFWFSTFTWDVINYLIPVIISIILIAAFGLHEFINDGRVFYVFGIMVLSGLAHITQMYLLSYIFKISATGFAILSTWNILTSQATLTPTQILTLPQLGLVNVSNILEWIFLLIFPNFSMGQALIDLYNNYQITNLCESGPLAPVSLCSIFPNPCCIHLNKNKVRPCGETDCLLWNENYLAWERPGLLRFFIFLPIQFFIHFSIILLYEAGYLRKLSYILLSLTKRQKKKNELSLEVEQREQEILFNDIPKDSDVIAEESRIKRLSKDNNNELFIVDALTKYYSKFMAVKGISFSVKNSECFGLLGVNGAGKTSTFKMITGDEFITNGEAYLNKIRLKKNIKKVN
jgi:ATP-binding cassette, subfamily A (ABC1), member 3